MNEKQLEAYKKLLIAEAKKHYTEANLDDLIRDIQNSETFDELEENYAKYQIDDSYRYDVIDMNNTSKDAELLHAVKQCLRRIVSKSILNRYVKCQMLHDIYYADSIDALTRLNTDVFMK